MFTRSYHKTESVIKTTAEKTSSLFSGFTTKLSQMKNSESFKSFEDRVGGAYESVKVKVKAHLDLRQYSLSKEILLSILDESFNIAIRIRAKLQRLCQFNQHDCSNHSNHSRRETNCVNEFAQHEIVLEIVFLSYVWII